MKVSELPHGLWFGDVVIQCVDTNIITGEPMKQKGYMEFVVTWIRQENRDGPRQDNPNDFDVQLMEMDGEVITIRDVATMADWEYSHCAFQRGAWREGE